MKLGFSGIIQVSGGKMTSFDSLNLEKSIDVYEYLYYIWTPIKVTKSVQV